MPSALALILFAYGVSAWTGLAQSSAVHGLKLAAVAIVAQAVWGMAKSLCPDRARAGIAVGVALMVLAIPSAWSQIAAITAGALLGRWRLPVAPLPPARHRDYGVSRRVGALLLALFGVLLFALPALAASMGGRLWPAVAAFYKAGALVFGGGHVVLPLLQASVVPPGWVSNDAFLAGYGAAQAVPGPLFTFAAYLGAAMRVLSAAWVGGLLMLVTVLLPGFLLMLGALPFWEVLRQRTDVQRAMAGANAAVVGILLAALYDPVWVSAIHGRADFGLALLGFTLLVYRRASPRPPEAMSAVLSWVISFA